MFHGKDYTMRTAAVVLTVCCLVPVAVHAAGADKALQNLKGSVSYQHGAGSTHEIAPSAVVVLADSDVANTGDASQAAVTLPDSSRVTMGSDTRVQLAFFNQAERANAKFIVYQGKTRFKVEHPNGTPANYTFQTPTADVGVRGTEGDIGVDAQGLTVNVYGLSDPNLPVIVNTNDGKQYVIKAGQQLVAKWVNGKIQATIDTLTQQAVAQFDELGAPVSDWAASVRSLTQAPCDTAASAVDQVTGGLFGRVVHAAKPCQSPSPSPSPSDSSSP